MPRETFIALREHIRLGKDNKHLAESIEFKKKLAHLTQRDEFPQKKANYFGRIALTNMDAMHKLKEDGVLGGTKDNITESRKAGWRNVGEHNGAALFVAYTIGKLSGLPIVWQRILEYEAGVHDSDKRVKREGNKVRERRTGEGTIIEYDAVIVAQAEAAKSGLGRVTGGKLDDYQMWGYPEMALRYTDSILIPIPNTPHTDIVHWRERIDELRVRNDAANKAQGKLLGDGILFYDELEGIMEEIEPKLYDKAMQVQPKLRQKYPRSEMYFQLVKDQIMQNIENTPLKPQRLQRVSSLNIPR